MRGMFESQNVCLLVVDFYAMEENFGGTPWNRRTERRFSKRDIPERAECLYLIFIILFFILVRTVREHHKSQFHICSNRPPFSSAD